MPQNIDLELKSFPIELANAYSLSKISISKFLDHDQMIEWANLGLKIAHLRKGVRSWELAVKFYQVSPSVCKLIPYNYFYEWMQQGLLISKKSKPIADSFFSNSPNTVAVLRSRHLDEWVQMGLGLYTGIWKSTNLATTFFQTGDQLLRSSNITTLKPTISTIKKLSIHSYEAAAECMKLLPEILTLIPEKKTEYIELIDLVITNNWQHTKSFIEISIQSFGNTNLSCRNDLIKLLVLIVSYRKTNISNWLSTYANCVQDIDNSYHSDLINSSKYILNKTTPEILLDYIKSLPFVSQRVSANKINIWVDAGIEIYSENEIAGASFFRKESTKSIDLIDKLSSVVDLEQQKNKLELYCIALTGNQIELTSRDEIDSKNIGWGISEFATTEGETIYLPSQSNKYNSKEDNNSWYKVIATHQTGHIEFGSFKFSFETKPTHFTDIRNNFLQERKTNEIDSENNQKHFLTDIQNFFSLFPNKELALDIFTVIEGGRIDNIVKHYYSGIKREYEKIQLESLELRPDLKSLAIRKIMVEILLQFSISKKRKLSIPTEHKNEIKKITSIARKALKLTSLVEDTAEATLRIYSIISKLDEENKPDNTWEDIDLENESDEFDLESSSNSNLEYENFKFDTSTDKEESYDPIDGTEYRGEFKPELTQFFESIRESNGSGSDESLDEQSTKELLEQMVSESAEIDQDENMTLDSQTVENILNEMNIKQSKSTEYSESHLSHVDEEGGELTSSEPETFIYPEWDFRARDYKPNWCVIKQKTMAEGDPSYYSDILNEYSTLMYQIRRQFELMTPELFKKERKLQDGEELDIDEVIEAMIDMKTGASPSEKLYWRRNKVQREVAVIFLLDTSASTAEAIDESNKFGDSMTPPTDTVEYLNWLKTKRSDQTRLNYKRIIDVEKESVVLLINALEAIGDIYGIYGFSGYGRENVEFYTVKDINEQLTDKVKSRIDKISPLHATRMGPAIRHATTKLEEQESKTKLLFLISDGRPQDRGYSREGVEKEYAVNDTKMALDEAKRKNINAFCLTVDKSGHDYLQEMCQDLSYEVLENVHMLPQRLLYLYKKLTM